MKADGPPPPLEKEALRAFAELSARFGLRHVSSDTNGAEEWVTLSNPRVAVVVHYEAGAPLWIELAKSAASGGEAGESLGSLELILKARGLPPDDTPFVDSSDPGIGPCLATKARLLEDVGSGFLAGSEDAFEELRALRDDNRRTLGGGPARA